MKLGFASAIILTAKLSIQEPENRFIGAKANELEPFACLGMFASHACHVHTLHVGNIPDKINVALPRRFFYIVHNQYRYNRI